MAQKIWFRINAVIHGGDFIHPNQVLFRDTNSSLDDDRRVNTKEGDARSPTYEAPLILWQKPPTYMYKVNWDH
jgi:hypothetical protein